MFICEPARTLRDIQEMYHLLLKECERKRNTDFQEDFNCFKGRAPEEAQENNSDCARELIVFSYLLFPILL